VQRRPIILVRILVLILMAVAGPPALAADHGLTGSDAAATAAAFDALTAGRSAEARAIAAGIIDPLPGQLVAWFEISGGASTPTFEEAAAFVLNQPDWPQQRTLRRRAEEGITASTPPDLLITFFERFEPLTAQGRVAWARALRARGDETRARDTARQAWLDGSFSAAEEQAFLQEFGGAVGPADTVRRLDRLLWDGRTAEVQRLLPRVDPGQRALATARLQLRSGGANADAAAAGVPASLQGDPGFVFERVRWRRKQERDVEARDLLVRYPGDVSEPQKWWDERAILARRALAEGRTQEAYRVASTHALTGGSDLADAGWLPGWIALRFLDDPATARRHFEATYASVETAVSRARGAYWAGRAAEAAGDGRAAADWYRRAAEHPTMFYGQLAAYHLTPGRALDLPADPAAAAAERRAFAAHDLTRAVHVLAAFGQRRRVDAFLLHLAAARESAGWKALSAELATSLGRPDLAVAVERQSVRRSTPLITHGYPTLPLPAAASPVSLEEPLVLAVIRQESGYRVDAVSGAGARGLMQLMPATAKGVSDRLGLPYSPDRLVSDPSYNMTLGQAYLGSMIGTFDGSYVRGLAAYNAGPGRVRSWRDARGRPNDLAAAIDWIEMIPYEETRTYVQRVLSHMHVYRGKRNGGRAPLTLDRDLL
jgi:soluble lytic murein transglycosylase